MQFVALTVADVRPVAEDAIAITFAIPSQHVAAFRHRHGQYLTLRATLDGAVIERAYSICSAAGADALTIAVRRIAGGAMSNHLHDHARRGSSMSVAPPAGDFSCALEPARRRAYLCIAAGVGITPILSIIRTVLAVEPLSRVTLLYGNRNTARTMFREELSLLKNAYLPRFQWLNIMSRETQDATVLNGRIDNRKGAELARSVLNIGAFEQFFLCGPEAMVAEVSRGLRAEGVDEARIHYELFRASAADARAAVQRHHERAQRYADSVATVRVRLNGRESSFQLASDGENILDAALDAGLEAPYSCRGGVCATCKALLREGQVEMDLNHALGDAEVAAGYVLTCQAHPLSAQVFVDYDAG
jgi:ring-1,2-phenylacetyl-CoA epoxidase subunit PaaE